MSHSTYTRCWGCGNYLSDRDIGEKEVLCRRCRTKAEIPDCEVVPDIAALRAVIERFRAEIERLRAEVAALKAVRVPNAKTIDIRDGDKFGINVLEGPTAKRSERTP